MKDTVPYGIACTMYGDIYVKHGERFWTTDYRLPKELADKCPSIRHGDLLFTLSGETAEEIGKCTGFLGTDSVCIGGDILALRPKGEYDPEFLCYAMNSPNCIRQKSQFGQGDAVVHISQANLSLVEVQVPSLLEQRRIASLLAAVDAQLDAFSALISKQESIKKSTLSLFLRSTKDWETTKLSDVGHFVSGSGFPISFQGEKSGNYPFCKVSDFSLPENASVITGANNYVSAAVARQLGCKIIPTNAIVFAKIGAAISLERKRLVKTPCCIDNNMMAYIPDRVHPEYCCQLLQQVRFQDLVEATALPSLSAKVVGNVAIPMPPLSQQQRIADFLSAIDRSILRLEKERKKSSSLKQGLMKFFFG